MSDGISETVDLALVRVAVLDFEERAAGLLDGETVAAEAGDFTRAAGLLRALLAAYESAVRERDTLHERLAATSGYDVNEAIAEAEDRINVKIHTALCGECLAFPGCGEACLTMTCDCCHDDASTDDLLADVAKLRDQRDRLQQRLATLRAAVAGMRKPHTPMCDELDTEGHESWLCDLSCDAGPYNAALDDVLARIDHHQEG